LRLPGLLMTGVVLVELAAYLDGTDPVEAVLKLKGERTVGKVAVDPHSPAATAIKPLSKAGVRVGPVFGRAERWTVEGYV
jgi:hypothetical protein